ncbi:histone 24-like [Artemia franciscana]|uniref:histone 24-like n=1 Tax=Artemia franciscana TaxID=6661 RepID=UPI0032D9F920
MSGIEAEVAAASVESQSMASPSKKEKKAKAPKRADAAKPKGDEKVKAPGNHPKYTEMITKSFADLKERGGPSHQAILKYIKGNLQVGNDAKVVNMHLKQALKRCLANRIVIIPKISLESEDERSGPYSTGNIDSDSQLVHTTVPRDAKKAKQSYKHSYRKEWPSLPELKAWLSQNEAKTEA